MNYDKHTDTPNMNDPMTRDSSSTPSASPSLAHDESGLIRHLLRLGPPQQGN